jgi:hypothetical protein
VLIVGDTSSILSAERIASDTAGVFSVLPNEVALSDRRTEMTNTYYMTRTRSGRLYGDVINVDNLMMFEMVNASMYTIQRWPVDATHSVGRGHSGRQ